MENSKVLLPTAYFGNIQYYTKLIAYQEIVIESVEHFPKQTFRNRCDILDANGLYTLTVPVKKGSEAKIFTRDVEIDYSRDWVRMHLRAFESAYRASAFYEFVIDELMPLWEAQPRFLLDFNYNAQKTVCELINISANVSLTDDYVRIPKDVDDFRERIHPKPRMYRPDDDFVATPYYQVFKQKFDFQPNLSILDLLFNEGPAAEIVLRNSIVKSV